MKFFYLQLFYKTTFSHKINFYSSKIGDASFIVLDCDSGNVDDCDEGPDESVPSDCQGVLILSETESRCGLNCSLDSTATSSLSEIDIRRWTYWSSQAINSFYIISQSFKSEENF